MLRLTVVGMALLCSAAGGDQRYGPNPYASYQPQPPDYVEKPYTPLYPSSYRQYSKPSLYPALPEYPYSAYETTSQSPYSYQQPSYKPKPKPYAEPYPIYQQQYKKQDPYPQPSNYGTSSYGDAYPSSEPQGYPAATQYKPQPAYQTASSYAGAYKPAEPKAPALAAICDFSTGAGSGKLQGRLTLTQAEGGYNDPIHISGTISYLKPSGKHGMHIHQFGDFSEGCTSAGPHFNPLHVNHGPRETDKQHRHLGDLGNIVADYDGVAHINFLDHLVSLADGGHYPVGGRAIVIHEKPDDLGRGGNEESKKTGNSGARIGCCQILMVDPTKIKI